MSKDPNTPPQTHQMSSTSPSVTVVAPRVVFVSLLSLLQQWMLIPFEILDTAIICINAKRSDLLPNGFTTPSHPLAKRSLGYNSLFKEMLSLKDTQGLVIFMRDYERRRDDIGTPMNASRSWQSLPRIDVRDSPNCLPFDTGMSSTYSSSSVTPATPFSPHTFAPDTPLTPFSPPLSPFSQFSPMPSLPHEAISPLPSAAINASINGSALGTISRNMPSLPHLILNGANSSCPANHLNSPTVASCGRLNQPTFAGVGASGARQQQKNDKRCIHPMWAYASMQLNRIIDPLTNHTYQTIPFEPEWWMEQCSQPNPIMDELNRGNAKYDIMCDILHMSNPSLITMSAFDDDKYTFDFRQIAKYHNCNALQRPNFYYENNYSQHSLSHTSDDDKDIFYFCD